MRVKRDVKWIFLILLVTIFLLFKLFYTPRLFGHDTVFHTSNIIYLSKSISINNIFGSNIINNSINMFGYGTYLFYPKLPHLLAAYIYKVINDVYFSMNIIYFVITFLSGIFMYYLSKKLFNDSRVSFLSSVIYLTYSYHLCDIYIRDAFAESFMFMVIPMVFLGLLELRDNSINKFYLLFILGYVIGIYSHLVSMVFCTLFVLLFIIFYRAYILVGIKIKHFIISIIIIFLVSLPFLISIIEHRFLGDYVVFGDDFSSKDGIVFSVIPFIKYFINDKKALFNNILIYLNYSTILLMILTFIKFCLKNNRDKYKDIRRLLIFSILVFIAFINSKWLWNNMPSFFSIIQFAWRITTFLSVSLSLYVSMFFLNRKKYDMLYILFIVVILIEGINNIYYYGDREYSYKYLVNSDLFMGWQKEYLPVNNKILRGGIGYGVYNKNKLDYKIYSSDSDVFIKVIYDTFPDMKFKLNNVVNDIYIYLPRTYYLGYYINNKDVIKEYSDGFIYFKTNKDGIYKLEYKGTIYTRVAIIIRNITIIIILVYGVVIYGKKKNCCFNSLL